MNGQSVEQARFIEMLKRAGFEAVLSDATPAAGPEEAPAQVEQPAGLFEQILEFWMEDPERWDGLA